VPAFVVVEALFGDKEDALDEQRQKPENAQTSINY
jgi:hypothetical protein